MEPNNGPTPWRVLDASGGSATSRPGRPASAGSASAIAPSGAGPNGASQGVVTVPAGSLRYIVAGVAIVACAVVAFLLALGGASGDVAVDGGGDVPADLTGIRTNAPPASGRGTASVAPAGRAMVVQIVGAVSHPGVFHVPAGARVADLIELAGGFGPRVDTAGAGRDLNLAAELHDGDQVRVPSRDDVASVAQASNGATSAGTGVSSGPGSVKVSLNEATAAQLDTLPGVGPVTAEKIIAAREEAPFKTVDELRSRGLLGQKTFDRLRDLVSVP